MALHPDFPGSPHLILYPGIRWFPADEDQGCFINLMSILCGNRTKPISVSKCRMVSSLPADLKSQLSDPEQIAKLA